MNQGDYQGARALSEEELAIARQSGDQGYIRWGLCQLGRLADLEGDYEGARPLLEESLQMHRQLGQHADTAWPIEGLAAVARSQGDYEEARALYRESLGIFRPAGEQRGIAAVLEGLAGIAAADDRAERAARLFGAAEALRAAIATPLAPGERADYDRYVAATHAALGQEAFAAAWEAGRALSLDEAGALALGGTPED
jgi:tetratricopeptide (TPR) repeat protein